MSDEINKSDPQGEERNDAVTCRALLVSAGAALIAGCSNKPNKPMDSGPARSTGSSGAGVESTITPEISADAQEKIDVALEKVDKLIDFCVSEALAVAGDLSDGSYIDNPDYSTLMLDGWCRKYQVTVARGGSATFAVFPYLEDDITNSPYVIQGSWSLDESIFEQYQTDGDWTKVLAAIKKLEASSYMVTSRGGDSSTEIDEIDYTYSETDGYKTTGLTCQTIDSGGNNKTSVGIDSNNVNLAVDNINSVMEILRGVPQ